MVKEQGLERGQKDLTTMKKRLNEKKFRLDARASHGDTATTVRA
jgi:hypothetical protein